MAGRNFTQEEDEYIKNHYGSDSGKDIARHLGRSLSGVRKRACKLGLCRKLKRWTPEEDEIIRSSHGRRLVDVAKELGRAEGEVSARVKKLGYSSWYEIKGYARYGGYECIRKDGKREVLHRAVMEDHIGRDLRRDECVHHIDLDKSNNSIENLHLFNSRSDHRKAHVSLEAVGSRLLQRGVIYFDASEGVYKLCDTGE